METEMKWDAFDEKNLIGRKEAEKVLEAKKNIFFSFHRDEIINSRV